MAAPIRKKCYDLPDYTAGENISHVITHGLGAVLSVAGLVFLVLAAVKRGDAWHVVSVTIYSASLVILYGGSTLYHSISSPFWRHVAKIIDHSAIYLLIAGTYTPFTLVTLRGPWGWTLFGIVWGLAIIGMAVESWWVYRPEKVATAIFIAMGWVVLIAIKPLMENLSAGGIRWLVAGGLLYSAGTIFYIIKDVRFMHAVWHLFVLGGSVCHFFAVMYYVVPG